MLTLIIYYSLFLEHLSHVHWQVQIHFCTFSSHSSNYFLPTYHIFHMCAMLRSFTQYWCWHVRVDERRHIVKQPQEVAAHPEEGTTDSHNLHRVASRRSQDWAIDDILLVVSAVRLVITSNGYVMQAWAFNLHKHMNNIKNICKATRQLYDSVSCWGLWTLLRSAPNPSTLMYHFRLWVCVVPAHDGEFIWLSINSSCSCAPPLTLRRVSHSDFRIRVGGISGQWHNK